MRLQRGLCQAPRTVVEGFGGIRSGHMTTVAVSRHGAAVFVPRADVGQIILYPDYRPGRGRSSASASSAETGPPRCPRATSRIGTARRVPADNRLAAISRAPGRCHRRGRVGHPHHRRQHQPRPGRGRTGPIRQHPGARTRGLRARPVPNPSEFVWPFGVSRHWLASRPVAARFRALTLPLRFAARPAASVRLSGIGITVYQVLTRLRRSSCTSMCPSPWRTGQGVISLRDEEAAG